MAKNITIKRYNVELSGDKWEPIYPKTSASNILTGGDHGKITSAMIQSIDPSLISGVIPSSKLPAVALTNITVLLRKNKNNVGDLDSLEVVYANDPTQFQEGDVVILTEDNLTLIRNGETGTPNMESDFTQILTPADAQITTLTGRVNTLESDIQDKVDKINITAQSTLAMRKIKYNAQGQITGSSAYAWGDLPLLEEEVEAKLGYISLIDNTSPTYSTQVAALATKDGNIYFEY